MNIETLRTTAQEDIRRIRAALKPESVSTSEKSFSITKHGDVAVLLLDQANERANVLSTANMLRLLELFMEVEKDTSIGCLVIKSAKPSIFVAGADISEIKGFAANGSAEQLIKLQNVFTYLENLPIPSIAAIHGACMGGGTELSLGCDYRVATDAPETKIALPEVMLGVLPGWGGTQRMPRLIGLESSLDLILSGRAIDGKKAKKMGLVDRVHPKEFLDDKVMEWAAELAKTRKKRKYNVDFKDRLLEKVPGGKWIIFDQARKKLLEKTKGHYPAPMKALEVIRQTYGGSIEAGLKVEAQAFTELMMTQESKNLIAVYYLNERVKKSKGVEGAKPLDISRVGVLGAGVMGGGIAQLFAAKKVRVRLKDINWDAIAKGFQAANRVFKKLVEKRKMRSNEKDNAMAFIEGTTNYDGFKTLDLVVEAIVEDLAIKQKVFGEVEQQVSEKTILATNTSSLSVTQIAKGAKNQSRVVGMHFFNPVDKMPLVEVIKGEQTSDEAAATVFNLSKKLGKTPILVKDSPGFVVNRILGPYLNETVFLMEEGVTPKHMDKVIEAFGMPMGPAALIDEVGLDVCHKVAKVLYGAFGERMKPPHLLDAVIAEKRLGKKTGKGIYVYEDGGKSKVEDPGLLTKLGIKPSASVDDKTIERRLVYVMINEAARCIEENLVQAPEDLDIGMIFGTGFPPFRGGLLRYADTVGAETIVSDLELFSNKFGPRFKPAALLQQHAISGKKFFS